MSNRQPKTTVPTDADLAGNPGIGATKGTTAAGEDVETIEADSTLEGDVMNETQPDGGVDPAQTGRTNR